MNLDLSLFSGYTYICTILLLLGCHHPSGEKKALAIREDIATSSLTKRGETQGCSWGVVLESELARINDAADAWRHCFLAASDKLKELAESARRERVRAAESWKEKARFQ